MREKRAFQIGDVIPGQEGHAYRVDSLIGEGGFSEVYKVELLKTAAGGWAPTGMFYAVKALRTQQAASPKTVERLRREGQTLYLLRHPNVVRVRFVGVRRLDSVVYMVMELLVGRTLRDLQIDVGVEPPRPWREHDREPVAKVPIVWTLEIMSAIAAGLEAVHEHAIHRDIKPENIHIGDDGRFCLIDLGTGQFTYESRITTKDVTIGTVRYMSPEQLLTPDKLDKRSDLFSLGDVMYELLSGHHPFESAFFTGDPRALGTTILYKPHPPLREIAPHVPAYIAAIVEKLLRKEPKERYPNAGAVHDVIKAALRRYEGELQSQGKASPLPLAQSIAGIPRIVEVPRVSTQPELDASPNPFITISLPPELANEVDAENHPTPQLSEEEAFDVAKTRKLPLPTEQALDAAKTRRLHLPTEEALDAAKTRRLPLPAKHQAFLVPTQEWPVTAANDSGRRATVLPECITSDAERLSSPAPPTTGGEPADAEAQAARAEPIESQAAEVELVGGRPEKAARRRRALAKMVAQLPPGPRRIFWLHQIEERSLEEIAAMVQAPVPLVVATLREAQALLADMVREGALRQDGSEPMAPAAPPADGSGPSTLATISAPSAEAPPTSPRRRFWPVLVAAIALWWIIAGTIIVRERLIGAGPSPGPDARPAPAAPWSTPSVEPLVPTAVPSSPLSGPVPEAPSAPTAQPVRVPSSAPAPRAPVAAPRPRPSPRPVLTAARQPFPAHEVPLF